MAQNINIEEFNQLCSEENIALIEKYIDLNPATLALKGVSGVVCNQIKYLQRCKGKLPHYYEARCIIPSVSYEQSSSYQSLVAKREQGETILDLTCGLGVDIYHYSKNFRTVIALEQSELLAYVAQENFKRLGAENIRVINCRCEDFLRDYNGAKFDLVYIDPARRDQTKRLFLINDCSPNVLEIFDDIRRVARKVIVKLSPLFDVSEAVRLFGKNAIVKVISVRDECKELCVEVDFEQTTVRSEQFVACAIDKDLKYKEYCFDGIDSSTGSDSHVCFDDMADSCFISILDVSIRKLRCSRAYYKKYHQDCEHYNFGDIALWKTLPKGFCGKVYEIVSFCEYKPKLIKKMRLGKATIILQNFPYTIEEVQKSLSLKSGDINLLLFTTINNKEYMYTVKELR